MKLGPEVKEGSCHEDIFHRSRLSYTVSRPIRPISHVAGGTKCPGSREERERLIQFRLAFKEHSKSRSRDRYKREKEIRTQVRGGRKSSPGLKKKREVENQGARIRESPSFSKDFRD